MGTAGSFWLTLITGSCDYLCFCLEDGVVRANTLNVEAIDRGYIVLLDSAYGTAVIGFNCNFSLYARPRRIFLVGRKAGELHQPFDHLI